MARVTGSITCAHHPDLPVLEPKDLGEIGDEKTLPDSLEIFETAYRTGALSTVQDIVTSAARTPIFLHYGLYATICATNLATVHYLLSAGAPIAEQTHHFTLFTATPAHGLQLLELFHQQSCTPVSPADTLLLSHAVTNLFLLRWLLAHGADPNLVAWQVICRMPFRRSRWAGRARSRAGSPRCRRGHPLWCSAAQCGWCVPGGPEPACAECQAESGV